MTDMMMTAVPWWRWRRKFSTTWRIRFTIQYSDTIIPSKLWRSSARVFSG